MSRVIVSPSLEDALQATRLFKGYPSQNAKLCGIAVDEVAFLQCGDDIQRLLEAWDICSWCRRRVRQIISKGPCGQEKLLDKRADGTKLWVLNPGLLGLRSHAEG